MPVFDIIVALVLTGGIGIGTWKAASSIVKKVKKYKRRQKGIKNAHGIVCDEICFHCNKQTLDPEIDFFIDGHWWHNKCFNELKTKDF